MSQQPSRITRRLETQPVEPATTPGDGGTGQQETPMPDDGGLLGQIAEMYATDNARMAQRSRDRRHRMSDREQLAEALKEVVDAAMMATLMYGRWELLAADAILATGWRPPHPKRITGPNHSRAPHHTEQAPSGTRYFVGYIAELNDDSYGEQLMEFSGTAFLDEAEAREELADAEAWRPGWHLYALTDITERPTE